VTLIVDRPKCLIRWCPCLAAASRPRRSAPRGVRRRQRRTPTSSSTDEAGRSAWHAGSDAFTAATILIELRYRLAVRSEGRFSTRRCEPYDGAPVRAAFNSFGNTHRLAEMHRAGNVAMAAIQARPNGPMSDVATQLRVRPANEADSGGPTRLNDTRRTTP
jgi:hypothetical protein